MLDIKYRFTCSESDLSKLFKSAKTFWQGLSEKFVLLSTLPMMIQHFGKSTNFGSKKLVCSENNKSAKYKVLEMQILT